MGYRDSRYKLPPVESWSPAIRLLVKPYSFQVRLFAGILISLALLVISYVDLVTFDRVNLKPLCGLVVLIAFVIFRLKGFWWLFAVVFVYQVILQSHRMTPSHDLLIADDVIVAITFGVIGLLMTWLAEGLFALQQAHQDLQRDLKLAGEIQRLLMSPSVKLPWISLEGILKPTGEVGGDFYSIIPLDEKTVFFAIGDVQGKGVAAALTMSKTAAIVAELSQRFKSLDRLLSELNARLLNDETTMITAIVGKVTHREAEKTELRIARAGHEKGLLIQTDGHCLDLSPPGLPLGLFPDSTYEEEVWWLSPGDRVLFYTDGILDARDSGSGPYTHDQFVFEAFRVGQLSKSEEVHAWIDELINRVQAHRGNRMQEDDIAILGLMALPSESSVRESPGNVNRHLDSITDVK